MKAPDEITRYISRIKNQRKQEYARKYLEHAMTGGPSPSYDGSYMAAQGVRMTIDSILSAYCLEV